MSWFKKGLKFGCTQCGQCCTGTPGFVWVDDAEIEDMAKFLGVAKTEFIQRYTREVDGKLALLEFPRSYDCIFLRDKKCLVYNARPKQCRTFPFWPENLNSKEAWEDAKRRCEGIDSPDAPTIPLVAIRKILEDYYGSD